MILLINLEKNILENNFFYYIVIFHLNNAR